MEERGAENLLADVEKPDLERSPGTFAPAFEDKRDESKEAKATLDDQGKRPQEAALLVVRV